MEAIRDCVKSSSEWNKDYLTVMTERDQLTELAHQDKEGYS